MKRCKTKGCTEKLLTQSEHNTGFCFHCGDGEYHADEEGSPRRSEVWHKYIGERQ